nr:ATP-binding cassette domain-containing protein [Mesorhizobium sp.]
MEIIRGVDLSVREGERHAVIGPNGAGKSTLFHLVSGYYRPSGGASACAARRSVASSWRRSGHRRRVLARRHERRKNTACGGP